MRSQGKARRKMDAPSRRPWRLAAIAVSAIVVIALSGGIVYYRADGATGRNRHAAEDVFPITLDPRTFDGEARQTYRIAREHPELLAKLYCYCHCDVRLGHRNLLDCYRDTHAASCGICMGEAGDAEAMAKHGASVEEIRDALRVRYRNSE